MLSQFSVSSCLETFFPCFRSRISSSPLEFRPRSSHFTSPEAIPYSSIQLEKPGLRSVLIRQRSLLERSLKFPPTCPLHRVLMNNTCPRCMTASAGTIIRRDYSSLYVILHKKFRPLQQMPSSAFGVAGSGFRPLTKILDCCLPSKSGSFSTPVRRISLSTPLSFLGLDEPLPLQLPPTHTANALIGFVYPFLIPGFDVPPLVFPPFPALVQCDSTPVHQDTFLL